MDDFANVLLLRAIQAWCDECGAEQLLMPADDNSGLCCTVCDAAVFPGTVADEPTPLRHTA